MSSIDPVEATRIYRDHVLTTKGAALDEQGRAMLAEDLRSPCTEEVAVFQAFSRIIGESRHKFVVVDTAPTGHTLLLLDATGSYHREVARQLGNRHFTTPLMRLQDPELTKVIIVTLAETTPVLEAAGLAGRTRTRPDPSLGLGDQQLARGRTSDRTTAPPRAVAELPEIDKVQRPATRIGLPWCRCWRPNQSASPSWKRLPSREPR